MANNKVKFGLKNVHFAKLTQATPGGTPTYATPVAWPGAVNLTLDAEGSLDPFNADNVDYWIGSSNNGYSGSFESALIPDEFRTTILGEVKDETTGLQYEDASAVIEPFALLFQVEGDAEARRFVAYNVKATRPSIGSQTTGTSIAPVTETLDIRAAALVVGEHAYVQAKAAPGDASYTSFFEAVKLPGA